MSGLLDKIYNYNYFGYYLLIAIVLLLVLFIIILVFGKKDQHKREVEATKKLEQINSEDAFKEESTEVPLNIEPNVNTFANNGEGVSIQDVPTIENNSSVLGEIPDAVLPSINTDLDASSQASNTESNLTSNVSFSSDGMNKEEGPILDVKKEEPFVFNSADNLEPVQDINASIIKEMPPVENNTLLKEMPKEEETSPSLSTSPVFNEVDVPEFNFDEIVKSVEEAKEDFELPNLNTVETKEEVKPNVNQGPQIFSSVYVPDNNRVENNATANPGSDELDFEMPVLKKKEEEIEKPILNDYNLDSLAGEEYNIK